MTHSDKDAQTPQGKNSGRPLPDASSWGPRDASQTLASAFVEECNAAEERLLRGLQHERKSAVDSFDSGLPFEGLVRHELKRLLPRRYSVTSGLVLDRDGRTAGNCDIVVFNEIWFAPVKCPATEEPGRTYLPVEGVYAVGEVKQTLSSAALDQAMEKLVKCHRLTRPRTYAHRLVENREGCNCPHGLTNPLFSFVLAGAISPEESLQALVERFFDISRQLKRLEVIRALCILGHGTAVWSYRDPLHNGDVRPALFVESDLFHPIFPVLSSASDRGPLLFLMQMLQQGLFHVVLGPEDLAVAYSFDSAAIKVPTSPEVALPPDQEWLALADEPCREDHS
jgi:hypothetical protein